MSIFGTVPQVTVPLFMLNINIEYPNDVYSDITALVNTGGPGSLLKSTNYLYVYGVKQIRKIFE